MSSSPKLYWDCDTCHKVESAHIPGEKPENQYAVGDWEPCIYCEGVAYVRRHGNSQVAPGVASPASSARRNPGNKLLRKKPT